MRDRRAGNGAGPLYFTAGAGGDASTASNDGGAGGNFVFTGGNGGNSPGGAPPALQSEATSKSSEAMLV